MGDSLDGLTLAQRDLIAAMIRQFGLPFSFKQYGSDFVTEQVLEHFGNLLRLNHALSRQTLSKDRFEFALERSLKLCQIKADLVESRTHPGHDITIGGVPVSLKTEGAKNIKADEIHVSKWMELGKGDWQLELLRDKFLNHLKNYERVFTFRCLKPGPKNYSYELVEIPKALLLEAEHCVLEWTDNSKQNPKPGYGRVPDKFSLYFDAGSERKLQLRYLKKSLCHVHATWQFESAPLE